LLTKRT